MKVLVTMDLAGELVAEIGEVSEQVEVVQVASDEEALTVMPEIEVVCGKIKEAWFSRREKLKWIQSWGAGVDGLLHLSLIHI